MAMVCDVAAVAVPDPQGPSGGDSKVGPGVVVIVQLQPSRLWVGGEARGQQRLHVRESNSHPLVTLRSYGIPLGGRPPGGIYVGGYKFPSGGGGQV